MAEHTHVHEINGGRSGVILRKVRSESQATTEALRITLFRGERGDACGWYIGPLVASEGRLSLPFLPRSQETLASVAVVRAIGIARKTRSPICLVDPDDLWETVWRA